MYAFFFSVIQGINDCYPNLFNKTDEEGDEEREEQDTEGENEIGNSERNRESTFAEKYGWYVMVDAVAQLYNCDWDKVFAMPVKQWLNLYCLSIEKGKEEKRKIEEWKKRN